jgi:hypothetical protein
VSDAVNQLRLNNILGDIINDYGSLSRMDTMKLALLLLERGVKPPTVSE